MWTGECCVSFSFILLKELGLRPFYIQNKNTRAQIYLPYQEKDEHITVPTFSVEALLYNVPLT